MKQFSPRAAISRVRMKWVWLVKKQDRTELHQHGGKIKVSFRLEKTFKVIKSNLVNWTRALSASLKKHL